MTVVVGRTKRFTAASPVTRYWLAHCAGFSVTGGCRGTVERVAPGGQLDVRRKRHVRRVPSEAVVEIVPAEKLLVVRRRRRAPVSRGALRHGVGTTGAHLGALLLGLATLLLRAGRLAVRLVRSLPWQRSAHFVLSATTQLWQEISTTWWRLRTTSSAASSGRSSSGEARTTSST